MIASFSALRIFICIILPCHSVLLAKLLILKEKR